MKLSKKTQQMIKEFLERADNVRLRTTGGKRGCTKSK